MRDAVSMMPRGNDTAAAPPQPTVVWHVLTILWACPAAVMSTRVYPGLMLLAAVVLFGGLLGLIWCVQLARVLFDREARGRLAWRALGAWAFCPATGLLLAGLCLTQWPLMLRVKISEPALLRLVADLETKRVEVDRARRAGLMFVDEAVTEERSVLLHTNSGFIFREYGLAYSRDGSRPESRYYGATSFRHLFGRWYTFAAVE